MAQTSVLQASEERLWILAKSLAHEAGLDFTLPCVTYVQDFVRAGIRNMNRENRLGETDLEEAEGNLALFVRAMIEAAEKSMTGRAQDNAPSTKAYRGAIRENAFVAAKRLCPLWPFH